MVLLYCRLWDGFCTNNAIYFIFILKLCPYNVLTLPQDIKYQTSHQIVLNSVGQADLQVHFRCSDKPKSEFGLSQDLIIKVPVIENKILIVFPSILKPYSVWHPPSLLLLQHIFYISTKLQVQDATNFQLGTLKRETNSACYHQVVSLRAIVRDTFTHFSLSLIYSIVYVGDV